MTPSRGIVVVVAALLLGGAAGVAPAFAQTEDERRRARKLAGEGLDLARAGDLPTALERLRGARALVPAPTLDLEIARVLDRMDRLVEAAAGYRLVITAEIPDDAPPVHREARALAIDELARTLEATPTLTVVAPEGARVRIDGIRATPGAAVPVDPGPHRVVVAHAGRAEERRRIVVRGERAVVEVVMGPLPSPRGGGQPSVPGAVRSKPPTSGPTTRDVASSGGWATAGFSFLGLAGAGLVTWGVAGGIALNRRSALDDVCSGGRCPDTARNDVDRYDDARLVSTVGFVVGVASAAIATPLLIVAATRDTSVVVNAEGMAWRGRF